MDLYRRDPEANLPAYSVLSGLQTSLLRRVFGEYSYPGDFSPGMVESQFEKARMTLPSPSSFKDALYSS
jgi:hypothetical protein